MQNFSAGETVIDKGIVTVTDAVLELGLVVILQPDAVCSVVEQSAVLVSPVAVTILHCDKRQVLGFPEPLDI